MLADRDPAAPERAVLPNGRADAGEAPLGVSLAQAFLFRDRFVPIGPQACG